MRLLVVSSYFDTHPGGLEMIAGRLAGELSLRGCEVEWLATNATAPRGDGVPSIALSSWNGVERWMGLPLTVPLPSAVARIDERVRASDVVLIHDTLYLTSIWAFVSAKLHRKPILIVQHLGDALFGSTLVQNVMRLGERVVTRPMLASADQVAFISQTVARHFDAISLRRPAPVSFAGIDTAVFHPPQDAAEKARLRADQGFAPNRRVVLYVGRFVPTKGIELLRAVAAQRPELQVVMAGWGPVDPDAWGLPNVRVVRGLSGATLADLYRSADVFVLPSPSESLSLVVREAMACGLPVVCSDATAQTDIAIEPYLVTLPIGADLDLATASELSGCIDQALQLGGAAERAAFVRARYGWSRVTDVYAQLVSELAPAPPDQWRPAAAAVA
ncbi:MAG TPA: glycosyltransferase family 4 protein [Caulobacteraceae bacterium]|jgi:glycosyltransferase involved in cell wall biosynthesis